MNKNKKEAFVFKKSLVATILSLVFLVSDDVSAFDSIFLKGSYGTNPVGSATYNIPLEVPPAVKGLTPKPILSYSSSGQNGLFGMGWSFSTLSAITRCSTSRNGYVSAVELSVFDSFCLDGVLLVHINGVINTAAEYKTEIDNFQRIYSFGSSTNSYFVVYTKNGLKLTYGNTADSKIKAQNNPTVVTWALDSVTDINGNFYKIVYQNDQVNGQYYPLEINYTGNINKGISPQNSIKFFYEMRPDVSPVYRANVKLFPFLRVKSIKTYVNTNEVLNYHFSYSQSSQTGRSLLRSLSVTSADGTKSLMPTTFEWGGTDETYSDGVDLPVNIIGPGLSVNANYIDGVEAGNSGSGIYANGGTEWLSGDFNGDGVSDFIQVYNGAGSVPLCTGSYSNRDFSCTNFRLPIKLSGNGSFITGDFDGDGLTDFAQINERGSFKITCYSEGDGKFTCDKRYMRALVPISGVNINLQQNGMPVIHKQYLAGDFNGDGRADIFAFSLDSGSPLLCMSKGRSVEDFCVDTPMPNDFIPINMVAADFDGDGRLDIAYAPVNPSYSGTPESTELPTLSNAIQVCYSNGNTGFTCQLKTVRSTNTSDCAQICYGSFFSGDFNGDGVGDLAQFTSEGKISIYPSIGRNIQPAETASSNLFINVGSWKDLAFMVADLNGDSKADVITKNGSQTEVCYSKGDGDFNCALGPSISQSKIVFGNFSGDSTTSIVGAEVTSNYLNLYLNPSDIPDVITRFTNGIGEKTDIDYQPLTNDSIYIKGTNSIYPLRDIQTPMWVVAKELLDDGIGGKRIKKYKYYGSKLDVSGRGLLGFSKIEQIDEAAKNFVESIYYQNYPYTGQLAQLSRYVFNDDKNKFTKAVQSIYKYDSQLTGGSGVFATFSVSLLSQQDISYDYRTGALLSNSHVTSRYDVYGNKVLEVTKNADGNLVEKRHLIKNFTGDPNGNQSLWYLGRIEQTVQKNTNAEGASITRVSTYAYDSKHRLINETLEPNNINSFLKNDFAYDDFGNVILKEIYGSNLPKRSEIISYDSQGYYQISKQNSYGHSTYFEYDPKYGQLTKITDPNNLKTFFEYDLLGRLVSEKRSDGTKIHYSLNVCTSLECGTHQRFFSESSKEGGTTQLVYFDALNRQVATQTGGFNGKWIYQYKIFDKVGNLQAISKKSEGIPKYYTKFTYDPLKRVLTQANPDGSVVSYRYEGRSTTTTNEKGNIRVEIKSAINLLESVVDHTGKAISYKYDPFGNLISIVNSKGQVTSFTYNSLGHKISKTDSDSGTWLYEVNALGELLSSTDAKGNLISYVYDNIGRVLSQSTAEGLSNWVYDTSTNGIGKLATASRDSGHSKTYSYDSFGRISSVQTSMDSQYVFTTSYDNFGRISKVIYPMGFAIRYSYGINGYLSEIKNDADNSLIWKLNDVNADGKFVNEIFGNSVSTIKTYDPLTGFLSRINSKTTDGVEIQDSQLEYDSVGNLIERSELINHSTGDYLTENFEYDSLNRVLSVSGSNPKVFSYDELGNITSKSDVGVFSYGNGTSGNPIHGVTAIAGSNPRTFSYDANGNMTSGNGRTITWTSFNKPSRIANSQNTVDFFYDANLERFKEVSSSCRDIWGNNVTNCIKYMIDPAPGEGMHFEKETNGSVTSYRNYIYAGQGNIIGVYSTSSLNNSSLSYFHKDHLGSLSLVTNQSASVTERLSYDIFGKRRYVSGSDDPDNLLRSIVTHQGFTLQEHLDEGGLGLIHMNGRIFDPQIGRFFSPDPYVSDPRSLQAYNRFSYVNNNPLNMTDPSGFFSLGSALGIGHIPIVDDVLEGASDFIDHTAENIKSAYGDASEFINSNPWIADAVYAAAVVALIVVSGGTFLGAALAVASVAGGAAVSAAALAAFKGGDFWENFSNSFHANFRVGLIFLGGSAIAAGALGGGISAAGGNGLNGYIVSNKGFGPEWMQGAMTMGPATNYNGVTLATKTGSTTFGAHEFGHTLQFIGLSAVNGAVKANTDGVWASYIGLGITGAVSPNNFWERNATEAGALSK
ncbi:FG-GAP-like repeat-containing protein [Bdellovibrio bacteriovorus]|uniref:FG-GAP-like repeat-containing protein n=1 Tax=Bdellovibrio bacteriovorus TaxID=959 RepID=UPI0035A58008